MRRLPWITLFALPLAVSPSVASADGGDASPPAHGALASGDRFPSHVFTLAPHLRRRAEVTFDFGLVQPIVMHGFNAAVDVRIDRFVLTYSHGQGLQDDIGLTAARQRAGMHLNMPYSTGGGFGVVLVDELYVLADLKLHHFEESLGADVKSYDAVTVGGELGWRFFLWKGLVVNPVLRYWPNVWSSVPSGGLDFTSTPGPTRNVKAAWQGIGGTGLFPNVLVGWSFGV